MKQLIKFPEETRTYAFDFSEQAEVVGGETLTPTCAISSTRISGTGSITVGSAVQSGNRVTAQISGGTLGDRYELLATVTTSSGAILAAVGELAIRRIN